MRIIITGAASGIGRAAAHLMAAKSLARGESPRLMLADVAEKPLEEAAREVRALGAEAEIHVGDLAEPQTCAEIVRRAGAAFGGLDVLVSNAGIISDAPLLDLTLEDYERMFAINTRATWLLAKAAFPMLRDSRGCIVATCSLAAHDPTPGRGAYAPSKAALLMLVRQLANEWGRYGIRCNSISPGTTLTSIGREPASAKATPGLAGLNPLGVMSMPEDQAAAIAFLASPEARFIHGADLVVDGGTQTELMSVFDPARMAAATPRP